MPVNLTYFLEYFKSCLAIFSFSTTNVFQEYSLYFPQFFARIVFCIFPQNQIMVRSFYTIWSLEPNWIIDNQGRYQKTFWILYVSFILIHLVRQKDQLRRLQNDNHPSGIMHCSFQLKQLKSTIRCHEMLKILKHVLNCFKYF